MRRRNRLVELWRLLRYAAQAEAVQPAQWDVLLNRLELCDQDVLAELARGGEKADEIRSFACAKRYVAYVPDMVLVRLGMQLVDDEFSASGRMRYAKHGGRPCNNILRRRGMDE